MVRLHALTLFALLFGPAFGALAGDSAPHIDFLYIDANVGRSSGGHVAIRIGDDVFHYQHDAEGFAVLARDEWRRFRRTYNDLDNRNIHVAEIRVGAADLARIRDRFIQRHLIQSRHLDFLSSLRHDVELLQHSVSGAGLMVPGARLFTAASERPRGLESLSAAVESRYGAGFLKGKTAELERLLERLAYRQPTWDDSQLSDSRYPGYPVTFSETYLDAVTTLTAMRVLSGGWDVAKDTVLDPRRYAIPDLHARLTFHERLRLAGLARRLQESIVAMLASSRGDGGFPILLATARYLAVEKSLEQNRLQLVHPYSGAVPSRPFPVDAETQRSLRLAAWTFASSFREARSAFFRLDDLDEASLNVLENSAARYFEVHRAIRFERPFLLSSDLTMPLAPGSVRIDQRFSHDPAATDALETAQTAYYAFRARLRAIYPYNLLWHNCATELVRTVNSAFADQQEAARVLGAALDPAGLSVLIPFRLSDLVAKRLHVVKQRVLPSFRNRMLARFSAQQDPLWIYLAESNTATSSLYRSRPGDTLFLMFTEELPGLRPLFGAVNLSYGMVQAGAGLLTLPLDRGDRLFEGVRGALFSLPELAFFNIRKGSFATAGSL